MRDLRVEDLLNLVTSDVSDGSDHIKTMYEWHFERSMTLVKFVLGAAGALIAALLVAYFKAEIKSPWWEAGLIVGGATLVGIYGGYLYVRLKVIQSEYVASLKLYADLQELRPLLLLYLRQPSP